MKLYLRTSILLYLFSATFVASAQSTLPFNHPKDQIALQLGAIQMGYTVPFQLVSGNATNAKQAANALLMGSNALAATVAKPAAKVRGFVSSPSVDTLGYRDQLYQAVEAVVTSPVTGSIKGSVSVVGRTKAVTVSATLTVPPNAYTIPVPYAVEAATSIDAQVLREELVLSGVIPPTPTPPTPTPPTPTPPTPTPTPTPTPNQTELPFTFDSSGQYLSSFKDNSDAGFKFIHSTTGGISGGSLLTSGNFDYESTVIYKSFAADFSKPSASGLITISFKYFNAKPSTHRSFQVGLISSAKGTFEHSDASFVSIEGGYSDNDGKMSIGFNTTNGGSTTGSVATLSPKQGNWYQLKIKFEKQGAGPQISFTGDIYDLGATGLNAPIKISSWGNTIYGNSAIAQDSCVYAAISGLSKGGIQRFDNFNFQPSIPIGADGL